MLLHRDIIGLRERKKARTRDAIQQEALRLFNEQGYEATTVEQIAAAAEVSPSTFFRYFPRKEDVVLFDVLDPVFAEAFRSQPSGLTPIQALRASFREVFGALSEKERAQQRERAKLFLSVPELRAAWMDQLTTGHQMIAELLAERAGRSTDDFAVRNLAGAVLGVCLPAMLHATEDPTGNVFRSIDPALAHLEAGLPLRVDA